MRVTSYLLLLTDAHFFAIRLGIELGLILKNPLIIHNIFIDKTTKKEMIRIDRSKALILLTMVAVAAILGGVALTAYAADNGEENSNGFAEWSNGRMVPGTCGWSRGWLRGRGRFGFVEVSEEFEANVINIAKSDEDVQKLLDDDGYSITGVRPIIKAIVEADGDVVTKATSAIVMLEKDTTSRASVWVDLAEAKVTEIVILTRTVIEKP